MQIARDPFELAINVVAAGNFKHLIDCGSASLPKRFGPVASPNFDQMMQPLVGHIRQSGAHPGDNHAGFVNTIGSGDPAHAYAPYMVAAPFPEPDETATEFKS